MYFGNIIVYNVLKYKSKLHNLLYQRTSTGQAVSRNRGSSLSITGEIGGADMKDRKRQRANRKLKHREGMLDKHSGYGYKDLTPYNAVLKMKTDGKAQIALK